MTDSPQQPTTQKAPSEWSKIMKFAIPVIVSLGLCWLMFRNIDFADMMRTIRTECNFWWIALGMGISILAHLMRAKRWGIQLDALNMHTPFHILVYSVFGMYAVNLVFPRLGEVWRTGYISQRQHAPFSTVFGSMVAERCADMATVLLLVIVTFALASRQLVSYLSQNEETYHRLMHLASSPWLWLGLAAAVAAIWWFFKRKTGKNSLMGKVKNFFKGMWDGFSIIATMPHKGLWLTLTFGIWFFYFLELYMAFYAFPFTTQVLAEFGPLAGLVTFVFSAVAMGVPSNGGIGPWQWAVIFALSLYNVPRTEATAFANLQLGVQTVMFIVLGLLTFLLIMLDKRKSRRSLKN